MEHHSSIEFMCFSVVDSRQTKKVVILIVIKLSLVSTIKRASPLKKKWSGCSLLNEAAALIASMRSISPYPCFEKSLSGIIYWLTLTMAFRKQLHFSLYRKNIPYILACPNRMFSLTPSPKRAYPFESNAIFSNSLSSRLSHLSYLHIEYHVLEGNT